MHELSSICCERNPDADVQRREILALVKGGANVQETDKNGVTPLHHAVRFRSPAAVAALIECGANVNTMCKRSGSTALHRAVTSTGAPGTAGRRAQALEIVKLLLAAGADPELTNKLGKRPIDYVTDDEMRGLLSASQGA